MLWVLILPHQFSKVVDVLAQKSSQPQTESPVCLLVTYSHVTSTVLKLCYRLLITTLYALT